MSNPFGPVPPPSVSLPLPPPRFDLLLPSLAQMLGPRDEGGGHGVALLLININHFKRVNTLYGYANGDRVLSEIYQRLGSVRRPQDLLLRIDGNRFAMLLDGLRGSGHAILAAAKVQRTLETPFLMLEGQLRISSTIGIALAPEDGNDNEALLKHAELAQSGARDRGEKYMLFTELGKERNSERNWVLSAALEMALERREFILHFQPQVDPHTRKLHGAEVLLRWHRPGYEQVSPGQFIPLVERDQELMREITLWILNGALQRLAEWSGRGHHITLSVNLSAGLIHDMELVEWVRSGLLIWNVPAEQLTLEVTESAILERPEESILVMHRLRELGVKISIDDFGTGQASLAYFRDIPATELKVDKSFVQEIHSHAASDHIVHTIIDLAHRFNMLVVAEGVEEEATLERLKALECDLIQGHIFAPAMGEDEFIDWVEKFTA